MNDEPAENIGLNIKAICAVCLYRLGLRIRKQQEFKTVLAAEFVMRLEVVLAHSTLCSPFDMDMAFMLRPIFSAGSSFIVMLKIKEAYVISRNSRIDAKPVTDDKKQRLTLLLDRKEAMGDILVPDYAREGCARLACRKGIGADAVSILIC